MATPLRASPPPVSRSETGVILAIDYGQKRLGLALSDESRLTSHPYATWVRRNRRRDLTRLRELVRKEGVRCIVVGLPLHLDGTPSEMSEEASRFAERLEKALGLPVEMIDERLSSWEAGEICAGLPRGKRSRGRSPEPAAVKPTAPHEKFDDVAAAVILRDYLARAQEHGGSRASHA